jgi:hypothetical protein
MSWLGRRRQARDAQRSADRLDALLSDPSGADSDEFVREMSIARAVASSITTEVDPGNAARVALRAGLAVRRVRIRARRNVARAAFGLASMAAAGAAALVLALSSGGGQPVIVASPSALVDILNGHIKSVEQAITSGDANLVHQRVLDAQAAVQQVQTQLAELPAPSRAIVTPQISNLQWLLNSGQANFAAKSTTTTTSPAPTTTAGTSRTTVADHRSTTTSTTTASTTTSSSPSTSSTSEPSTSTSQPPPTTAAPTTSQPPPTRHGM